MGSRVIATASVSVEEYMARLREQGPDKNRMLTLVDAEKGRAKLCNDAYDGDDDEYDDFPSD